MIGLVRVGKWSPKVNLAGYKVWAGVVSKHTVAATTGTVQMDNATGIVNVICAFAGHGGTVDVCATSGPSSVCLGASLDATIGTSVLLWVAGD